MRLAVVMLIVCANLSNLQLARLGTRQKEMAMRAALGAGRLRLLRQMLTESVALSCCGAALGLILAVAGTRAIAHLDAFNIPLLASVRLDGDALGFTLLAAVLTGVLFGLLPALQVPSFGGRGSAERWQPRVERRSEACVGSQRAGGFRDRVCLHLTGGRGTADAEFSARPRRGSGISTGEGGCAAGWTRVFGFPVCAQQNSYIDEVLQRTRSLPGMRAAGLTDVLPFGGDRSWQVSGKGQVYPKDQHPEAFIRVVSDGYFESPGSVCRPEEDSRRGIAHRANRL